MDGERLVAQMARHFGHKVEVEHFGDRTVVRIGAGSFELRPEGPVLRARARAEGVEALARVQEVCADHLRRFAHAPLAITWSRDREDEAAGWVADYFNARHLLRSRDWVVALYPGAGAALRIAALTHDIERRVPGGPRLDPRRQRWDDPSYLREHSERSAAIVAAWLRDQGASGSLVEETAGLILRHEIGGSPDADLLQAADSLSFLEVNAGRALAWVREGRCDLAGAQAKLDWMRDRIGVEAARRPAADLHARATAALSGGDAPSATASD